jgi:geranylgeranyl diphosphate synthase type II
LTVIGFLPKLKIKDSYQMEGRFREYWETRRRLVDEALEYFLSRDSEDPEILWDAMKYTLFAGGKRLRPLLAIIGYELAGGNRLREEVLPIACSLELIHTFSLIHDDLPAMDNDDIRRGKPTSHRVFGEGIAILAGDALFAYAFKLLLESDISSDLKVKVMKEIVDATGSMGMIGGQVYDLISEGVEPTEELVKKIHERKTSALIRASLVVGGIAAEAGEELIGSYRRIGQNLGMAFQIVDDVLDETGEKEKLGKSVGKDRESGKCTYVKLYGLERAREDAKKYADEAANIAKLTFGEEKGWLLTSLAEFIVKRAH